MRIFTLYSLRELAVVIMLHIRSPYFFTFTFKVESLYPFIHLSLFPPLPGPGNHFYTLFL